MKSCSISTREIVLMQTPKGAANLLDLLRGVWISDKTLFRVFDVAFQMINNS